LETTTVFARQHALDKWVLFSRVFGDKFLGDVSNSVLRVEKLTAAGLSAKTIKACSQVVKLIVASAVDSDGHQISPLGGKLW
jgi:hypothetical protein